MYISQVKFLVTPLVTKYDTVENQVNDLSALSLAAFCVEMMAELWPILLAINVSIPSVDEFKANYASRLTVTITTRRCSGHENSLQFVNQTAEND